MKKTILNLAMAAMAVAAPLGAQATVFQFNASLNSAHEFPVPNGSTATGIATLFYNDFGTVSLADDSYDFSMSALGLSGPAGGFHIHAQATTLENAPVRVNMGSLPEFERFVSGGTLLVGARGVDALDSIPATGVHPAASFLDVLKGQLAYVNVHTALNPGGEIRGQLVQVAAIPEPETYAMLLAGLGLVGWVGGRRRKPAA